MIYKVNRFFLAMLVVLSLAACGSSSKPESDTDGDTIPDSRDNCVDIANSEQLNTDGDSAGDVCDDLPEDPSDTKDFDGDLIGDTADTDDDNDNTLDVDDAFPYDATEQLDIDGDGIGDNKDLDTSSISLGAMQLDQLLANGRATKFIGAVSHINTTGPVDYVSNNALVGRLAKDIGDVNGDGFHDLYVGNYRTYIDDVLSGIGYILFGQGKAWPATVDLADLSNTPHVVLTRDFSNDAPAELGADIAPVGDIDGDGIDDFMISDPVFLKPGTDNQYSGAVYLVFGHSTWITDAGDDQTITTTDLANYSVTLLGNLSLGLLGRTIENVGDLNGDGLFDVAISESTSDRFRLEQAGRVQLMFNIARYTKSDIGNAYYIEDIINTDDELNRVTLEGETEMFGIHIQGMGDFNADGFSDLVIYDKWSDKDPNVNGSLYVVFGKASASWADTWNLDTMNTGEGFIFANIGGEFDSALGRDFKVADLNTDNIPDLIIAHTSDNDGSFSNTLFSQVYVLWGGDKTWPTLVESGSFASNLGVTMLSEESRVSLGAQLEVVPDLNNNGYPEILIATSDSDLDGEPNPANKVYKFDASLIEHGLEIGPSMVTAGNAERITMSHIEEGDPFFMNVINDVNGDGLSEMTFSATQANSNGLTNNGEFYVLYGYDQLYPQTSKVSE